MVKTGVLIHVRHLDTTDWERLVWGDPVQNTLGNLPMLAELLLTECPEEPITTITMGCATSTRDGLSEGEYHKQYLIKHLKDLAAFPRLKKLVPASGSQAFKKLEERLQQIIVSPVIRGTREEIEWAAGVFSARGVERVVQVTAASHAPRCIQLQSLLRAEGIISKSQRWSVIADDMCFSGATPSSTLILEPPHRGDDPLMGYTPMASEVLTPYFKLSPEDKKEFIAVVKRFMDTHTR